MKTVKIKSDSDSNYYYLVTIVNGVAVSCSCPGFVHQQYCKHLERGDLYDVFMQSSYLIMRELCISKEVFNRRFDDTIRKYSKQGLKDPKTAAIKRVIEYADSLRVNNACKRCKGYGVIPRFSHINNGICLRCNGSGSEPGINYEKKAVYQQNGAISQEVDPETI